MRTSLNATSRGSHSFGQKRDASNDLVHVLREPPPKPCTNTRSATTDPWGENTVVKPKGPLVSSAEPLPLPSRLASVREIKERLEDRSMPWLLDRVS